MCTDTYFSQIINLSPSVASSICNDDASVSAVDQLTEPPPSTSAKNVCKDAEEPGSPLRLPPRRAPKNLTPKKARSPRKSVSPWKPGSRLPPRRAPRPATTANTEAGPSRVVITGSPKLVSGNALLALPPIPVDIFDELTSMFGGVDSSIWRDEPGMSDEEATRRKFGRDNIEM
jgi:hypothetical protein